MAKRKGALNGAPLLSLPVERKELKKVYIDSYSEVFKD
jgi:hypothetical protein